MSGHELAYSEPDKVRSIDSEFLSGKRYAYQEDLALVEDVGAGLDKQRRAPGAGEVRRRHQPVVSGAHHDGVEVRARRGTHGSHSRSVGCRCMVPT